MIVRTSAKSRLIRPGQRDQVGDALDALTQDVVGDAERFDHRGVAVEHGQQAVVRDDDQGVDLLRQRLDPGLGLVAAARALELERPRDDADRQRADLAGDLGDHRRCAGAGAAAGAGGDEHHVGAAQQRLDLVVLVARGLPAEIRVGARAEPTGRCRRRCAACRGAAEVCSDCRSVLIAMNSTPSISASIIRLTALTPAPPTPTTRSTGVPTGAGAGERLARRARCGRRRRARRPAGRR